MKLAALFSGGKDSTYAAHLVEKGGHEVSIFASMCPARGDSYMFHGVNIHLTPLIAEALGKPLTSAPSSGEKEKEVDELKSLIELLDVEGVVTGAIASTYQRDRVNRVCNELGISHLSPLWGRSPREVLDDEIASGMEIVMVHVAANGLDKSWLGRGSMRPRRWSWRSWVKSMALMSVVRAVSTRAWSSTLLGSRRGSSSMRPRWSGRALAAPTP